MHRNNKILEGDEFLIIEFFFKVRINPRELNLEQLWDIWEKEAEAAMGAIRAGKIKALYKVAGQRYVIGIIDVASHDELDKIMMAALPMAHYLDFEEILPVRPYPNFAADLKRRWK